MRRVFSSIYEVCQKWAENTQEEGRAGNVSFSCGSIYSYGWYEMARILDDRKLVLYKDDYYSHTTLKHQNAVYSAAHRKYKVLSVADLGRNHEVNIAYYLEGLKNTVLEFDRTQRRGRWILDCNHRIYTRLLRYCEVFSLEVPVTLGLYLDKTYPFVVKRFMEVPGPEDTITELFLPKWLAKKGMDNVESRDILRTRNAELRREIIRILGIERICYDLKAKIIDRQGEYELVVLDLKDGRRRPYLKMHNPSVPEIWHLEGIHPAIKTVQDALNYRRYGDAMFITPEELIGDPIGWTERREYRENPESWKIKPEYETAPLFPGKHDWNPTHLT